MGPKKSRTGKSGAVLNTAIIQARPSAPHSGQAVVAKAARVVHSSAGVHPDLEAKLAVFTAFWYAAVRYQILKGLSDTGLARVLDVSDHTVRKWRSCVVASGVINSLIALVPQVPKDLRSANTAKVVKALRDRRNQLRRPVRSAGRKGANLPSGDSFAAAVDVSTKTILVNLVMGLDARASNLARQSTPGARSLAIAKSIKTDLIELYRATDELDIPVYREELSMRLATVSRISSRIALHKTLDYFSHFETEDGTLIAELRTAVVEAKQEARSYIDKLYRKMKAGNTFSEKASFLARLSLGEPPYSDNSALDPSDPFSEVNLRKARAADVAQLDKLIAAVALVRVAKGA